MGMFQLRCRRAILPRATTGERCGEQQGCGEQHHCDEAWHGLVARRGAGKKASEGLGDSTSVAKAICVIRFTLSDVDALQSLLALIHQDPANASARARFLWERHPRANGSRRSFFRPATGRRNAHSERVDRVR